MAERVDIFGVYEKAIHIEETSSNRRKAGDCQMEILGFDIEDLLSFRYCHCRSGANDN
jgi:hypothetical protein